MKRGLENLGEREREREIHEKGRERNSWKDGSSTLSLRLQRKHTKGDKIQVGLEALTFGWPKRDLTIVGNSLPTQNK